MKLFIKPFLFFGKISFILLCFLGFLWSAAFAEKWQDLKYEGYVNDYADILTREEESSLNKKIFDHYTKTGDELAVVVVKDIDGDYIEHYAVKLFETWKIGDEKKDTGVLFLVAINDKKMRIEVGYGLEPVLTDSRARYITDQVVRPFMQQGAYAQGVVSGTEAILSVLESGSGREAAPAEAGSKKSALWNIIGNLFPMIVVFGFVFFNWLVAVLARTKSWWQGGVLGAGVGGIFMYFIGIGVLSEVLMGVLVLLGLLLDYIVSKHFHGKLDGFDAGDPPSWWAGGTWGPGGSTWSSSDSFGGFGGGSSGGGGWSGDW